MVENKLPKQIQLYSCSNPNCQNNFENFIILHDKSKIPTDSYYACPYCFLKLDPTATQVSKKEESVEIETEINENHVETFVPIGCPHYLGYLLEHFKDSILSKECLLCSRMSECSIKKVISENIQ